mmetsp:Transcript_103529/g.293327  ORF Transcript_103529/g.293327 Transcript_103529/m.293327 type:complete len:375 (-) Transcript_103529:522-1646(-)
MLALTSRVLTPALASVGSPECLYRSREAVASRARGGRTIELAHDAGELLLVRQAEARGPVGEGPLRVVPSDEVRVQQHLARGQLDEARVVGACLHLGRGQCHHLDPEVGNCHVVARALRLPQGPQDLVGAAPLPPVLLQEAPDGADLRLVAPRGQGPAPEALQEGIVVQRLGRGEPLLHGQRRRRRVGPRYQGGQRDLVRLDELRPRGRAVQHQLLGVVVEEEASVGELRVHEQKTLEVTCGVRRGRRRVVDHVHPEVRHGLVEGRPPGALRPLRVLDEALDGVEDERQPLLAAVLLEHQPRDPQVGAVVPRVQRVVSELAQELLVAVVLALQPLHEQLLLPPLLYLLERLHPRLRRAPSAAAALALPAVAPPR